MIARFLVAPRDSIRLDTFRVTSGLVLLVYMAHWWLDDALEWLTVGGFHLSPAAAGSDWLTPPPLPVWALAPFGVAFFGALLAFTLGFRLPWSAGFAFLLFGLRHPCRSPGRLHPEQPVPRGARRLLRSFLGAPAGRWTAARRRALSVWPVRLFQATLVALYFTAGTCKVLYGDWLSDSHVLLRRSRGPFRTESAAWLLRHLPPEAFSILQSLSLAFELLLPFCSRSRGSGAWASGGAWGCTSGIALTMNEIGYLSLQTVAFYVLFMDDATLHAWRQGLASLGGRALGAGASRPLPG